MKEKKTTDEYLSEMGYSLFDEFGRVLKLAAIPPGGLVFDAATGSGRMTRVLFEKGYQVISGDIGWQQLDDLRLSQPFLGSQKIHWMQLDLYQLGFQDHCFDNIVCANLLHEVKHLGSNQRSILAKTMPRHKGRAYQLTGYLGSGFEAGDAYGEDRWLGIDRPGKLLLRPLKAKAREGKSQSIIGFLKHLSCLGKVMIKIKPMPTRCEP